MDLKGKLGVYELSTIVIVFTGILLYFAPGMIRYIGITRVVTESHERYAELTELSMNIEYLAVVVLGIGLFLSFRKIYQKLDLRSEFKVANYIYLILSLSSLIPLLIVTFIDEPGDVLFGQEALYFSSFIIPGIIKILLAIMFVSIFIAILKRERSEEIPPPPEQP